MTVLRAFRLLALALVIVLLPGAVAAQEIVSSPEPPGPPPEARPEPTGNWDVLAFDAWGQGLVEPRPETTLTMSLLTGGRLEGETGCGRYHGGYSLDGDRLGLGIISKGFGECGIKRTEEAVAFSVALESVSTWRAGGDVTAIELVDEAGVVRVVLARPDERDATGEWLVTDYARANGKLAQPLPDRPMRLLVTPAGTVSGSTGCRLFEGVFRGEGQRIVIGPVEPIGLPCHGSERKPERRFLAALGEVVFWEREGDGLTLTDAFGEPLVRLVAELPAASPASPDPSPEPAAAPTVPSPRPSPTPPEAGG